MDPEEQKITRSYPNADREIGSLGLPSEEEKPEIKPVHFSDILEKSKEDNTTYKTSTVRTLKDDLKEEASKGNFSIGKIMVANNRRTHNGQIPESVEISAKKIPLTLIIIVPVVCLIIIGVFSYIGSKSANTPQETNNLLNPTQQVSQGILYTEQSLSIDVSNKSRLDIYKEMSQNVSATQIPTGKIKSFLFTSKNGTSTVAVISHDFLNIIAPSTPNILLRNLKDEYVFGYYSYESSEPFIILESSNYDSSFAGMLDWEKSMYADLGGLIFKKESLATVGNGPEEIEATPTSTNPTATASTTKKTATTSEAIAKSEYDTPFVDKVISNNDARVLYRPNGQIAFFYTFFNKNTIIITTSEQTLREIIYRLTSGKITR